LWKPTQEKKSYKEYHRKTKSWFTGTSAVPNKKYSHWSTNYEQIFLKKNIHKLHVLSEDTDDT